MKILEITELRPWMAKIKEIDTRRQVELKRMAHFFDVSSARYAKRQNTGQNTSTHAPYPNCRNSYGHNNSSAVPSSSTNTYPPRLTDEEHCLLHDHEGCLKCQEFYIGHRAAQCQVTLSRKDYKVHTLQDALRAKVRAANQTAPVVAVTEDKTETMSPATDLVAVVFPQSTAVTANKSMSDGSDASLASVSATPPLKGKHFVWTCQLTNTADCVSLKAKALIDSGAHMVLIRPDVVERLAIPSFPLHTPEQVSVTLGEQTHAQQLMHYVVIEPTSLDGIFTSHRIHAVIAPGLCMPIILGLPFLISNNIVCDYTKRTCTTTKTNPPYNLLKSPKPKAPLFIKTNTPDILAALRECIMTLSFKEELADREADLRSRFSRIFEPPLHVDELPTDPVARIKLKDLNHTIKSRNYACPHKWKEAWHMLLQQHLEAGRI
jgi:hypothetical protein